VEREFLEGSGQIRIGEDLVDVSFRVPIEPCLPEELLPDVQRLADQIVDLASEHASGPISCSKGCGACCRQMVPITPPEARHLASLVAAMPEEQRSRVLKRFEEARAQMEAAGLTPQGHPDEDPATYRNYGLAYFRQGVPCPFLEDESCSIHPDRPLVCREYVVTSPPEFCALLGSGKVRQVPVPIRLWSTFGRSASHGEFTWLPLIDALEYAEAHPGSAEHTGPERVEMLLQQLAK
jgi:Fe-S-cluster containining protein